MLEGVGRVAFTLAPKDWLCVRCGMWRKEDLRASIEVIGQGRVGSQWEGIAELMPGFSSVPSKSKSALTLFPCLEVGPLQT